MEMTNIFLLFVLFLFHLSNQSRLSDFALLNFKNTYFEKLKMGALSQLKLKPFT